MKRLVLDTNVLIADAYNPGSASAGIVRACLASRAQAVVSTELVDEYEQILPRAVRVPGWCARYEEFLDRADWADLGGSCPRVVPEDPSDDILFATALAGGADAIVTNDAAVLRIAEHRGVRVLAPSIVQLVDEEPGS